jgi:spore coat protein A
VWGYGAVKSASSRGLLLHHAPSLTIESTWKRPVRIKWINDLKDTAGGYLPHLLPVDPTLHWANPPGGTANRGQPPDLRLHARSLHRPGADRDPPARRGRGRR